VEYNGFRKQLSRQLLVDIQFGTSALRSAHKKSHSFSSFPYREMDISGNSKGNGLNPRSTSTAKQHAGRRLSRQARGFTLIESTVLLACFAVAASAVPARCKNEVLSGRPLGGSDGLVASHIGMQRFHQAAAGALERIFAPGLQGWRDTASMD